MSNTAQHTPTPWAVGPGPSIKSGRYNVAPTVTAGGSAKGMIDEREVAAANAAFIVKAVNSHEHWAKWIVQRGPGLPDHACAECVPGGDLVKAGFQCVYHEALAEAESA